MEGFMREQNIETMKVVVWHVLEYDHFQVEEHSYGQFHEGDTYVIRWSYMIINAGSIQWRLNLRLHKVHLMCTWGARHL